MNILGLTKGTELESTIDQLWKGEAFGAVMYYALAYIAKERGLEELGEDLKRLASDECRHGGLYALLNGHVNDNLFAVLEAASQQEIAGAEKIREVSEAVRKLGFEKAALEIETAASDELHHGKALKELVEKYSNK